MKSLDYMVHVRLILGLGLLLAGVGGLWLDQTLNQLLFSGLAIILGILFVVLGLRPEQRKEGVKQDD